MKPTLPRLRLKIDLPRIHIHLDGVGERALHVIALGLVLFTGAAIAAGAAWLLL